METAKPYDILVTDSPDWPLVVVSYSSEGLEPHWAELELTLTEWVRSQVDDQILVTVVTDQKVKNGDTNRFQKIELDRFGLLLDTYARVTKPDEVAALSSLYSLVIDPETGRAEPLPNVGDRYWCLPLVSTESGPKKFKKKPVVIEACRWTGENRSVLADFMDPNQVTFSGRFLYIETLEGKMAASPGDWVIKGLNGEFYPCKPDIFEKSYDGV